MGWDKKPLYESRPGTCPTYLRIVMNNTLNAVHSLKDVMRADEDRMEPSVEVDGVRPRKEGN